jgi:hypothetical protein
MKSSQNLISQKKSQNNIAKIEARITFKKIKNMTAVIGVDPTWNAKKIV